MQRPLADEIRPKTLDEVVGQKHLLAPGAVLRRLIERGTDANMVFYGPSGTGKTTIANIIAQRTNKTLYRLNATTARIPQTTATPIQTPLTMLLKSKKPLPVTVTVQMSAKMLTSAKIMLTTLRTVSFFIQSHSLCQITICLTVPYLYRRKKQQKVSKSSSAWRKDFFDKLIGHQINLVSS